MPSYRVIDIETTGLHCPGAPDGAAVVCVQWGDRESAHIARVKGAGPAAQFTDVFDEDDTGPALPVPDWGSLLLDGRDIVAHNAVFDIGAAMAHRPELISDILRAPIICTQVAATLDLMRTGEINHPDPRVRSVSLARCARRYELLSPEALEALDNEKNDPSSWRLRFGELHHLPLSAWPAAAVSYALEDVRLTGALWETLEPLVPREPLIALTRAALALRLTTYSGIRIDGRLLRQIGDECAAASRAAMQLMCATGMGKLDKQGVFHKSLKELRAAVVRSLGSNAPRTTSGLVRTDEITIESCDDAVLTEWASAQSAIKLKTAFCDPWLGRSRVHPEYRLPMATCRTSSSNPNIQQPPSRRKSRFRDVFLPEVGNLWVDCDYSQIEVVAVAQICLDLGLGRELADAIDAGIDIHWTVARRLLGVSCDRDPSNEVHEQARARAKVVVFGRLGLMGPGGLLRNFMQRRVRITRDECQAIIDAYEAEYPCVRAYLDYHADLHAYGYPAEIRGPRRVESDGDEIQLEGPVYRATRKGTDACNTPFQGLVARGALGAVVDVTRASLQAGRRWWLSAFVHDELLVQAPADEAPAVLEEVKGIMVAAMRRSIPDVTVRVSGHVGPLWEH